LASVEAFAEAFLASYDRLDLLGLNAGIMGVDAELSVDGFELQFAANHLGHFALTARLMPLLRATPAARVVSHSSLAHRQARTWGNPRELDGYERWGVYAQTKLANLLFALELDRRLRAADIDAVALSAHPGMSSTELGQEGTAWTNTVVRAVMPFVTQSATDGALPFVRALTDVTLPGGTFVGPNLRFWGPPVVERPTRFARDPLLAAGLWDASVAWTGLDPFAV
jgi:NAD(P)-dependent dehydrogenase (short-subunit alcohol dehydrogenase family)